MSAHLLSVLCVTKGELHATPFLMELAALSEASGAQLVLAGDGQVGLSIAEGAIHKYEQSRSGRCRLSFKLLGVESNGYVESVLDDALEHCEGEYVLRMDDDEKCSTAMTRWILDEEYTAEDHWKFPTANLWRDENSVITDAPLWPDHHTRLSIKSKAGGRHTPHAGSPFGGGELADVIHEHHKFLVKSVARRRALARHYARMGALLLPFTLPEAVYDSFTLAPLGDGTVRAWSSLETEVVTLQREEVPA